jgi:hypothetical protein
MACCAIRWTGNWSLKVPVGMEVLASDRRLESPESAKRMVARYAINTLKAATARLLIDLIFHEVKLLDQ